ncbi:hypothetical protein [Metabacillus litoralis]|uniref:hypothetical protein n=1 Tax=Metabacillus litoralis TaxID=152268 RepID=UPI002040FCBB|nr:hypothetical protein [Metabacillus litoralis]MCM3651314.1 hypothetical protein [Metabacillus litoralis]
MEQCTFCKIEKLEDDFYMYSIHPMTKGRIQKGYVCKQCSERMYGDKWYPITGYDQKCEISNRGTVRELKENKYFNITHIQNASTSYVRLTKNGKSMRKNILPLMKRFCTEK